MFQFPGSNVSVAGAAVTSSRARDVTVRTTSEAGSASRTTVNSSVVRPSSVTDSAPASPSEKPAPSLSVVVTWTVSASPWKVLSELGSSTVTVTSVRAGPSMSGSSTPVSVTG